MPSPSSASHSLKSVRWNTKDGICLFGDVGGDSRAATVILLHGGGQTRHSWSGAVNALLDTGYYVINYDARGHGESSWSQTGQYTLNQRAADLKAVLDTCSEPFCLVGASLGGATALRAVADGIRPAAVSLVDMVLRPHLGGVGRVKQFMLGNPKGFISLEEAAEAISAYNPHRQRPVGPLGLARNLRRHPDGRYYWHWDPEILSGNPLQELIEVEETLRTLVDIGNVPFQLVRGLESDVIDESGIASLHDVIPSLEVYDVPGAGHVVAGDRNDAFNRGVISFLSRHLPLRSPAVKNRK